MLFVPLVAGMDSDSSSSRPPMFDGTRGGFIQWFMAMTGWVAWRLNDVTDIMDGTEPRPVLAAGGATAEDIRDWDKRNRKLYGAVAAATPDHIRTSLFNDHRNDGVGAVGFLRATFDAVDANDHAAHIARLQAHYIDPRAEINENDLRLQYDSMMVAVAGIVRTGNVAPVDSALTAMFENSLPLAYSQIRQLVRRQNHATFAAAYSDYMGQVRAELASRGPSVRAFNAQSSGFLPRAPSADLRPRDRSDRREPAGPPRTRPAGGAASVCLRCGAPDHLRPACTKAARTCKHCGADHADKFCSKAAADAFKALSPGAQRIIKRDVQRMQDRPSPRAKASRAQPPTPRSAPPDHASSPADQAPADAAAHAAAAAAASHAS